MPTSHFLCPVGLQVLYQGIERLEKEKANRDHLEMEIDVVSLWLLPSQRAYMCVRVCVCVCVCVCVRACVHV